MFVQLCVQITFLKLISKKTLAIVMCHTHNGHTRNKTYFTLHCYNVLIYNLNRFLI